MQACTRRSSLAARQFFLRARSGDKLATGRTQKFFCASTAKYIHPALYTRCISPTLYHPSFVCRRLAARYISSCDRRQVHYVSKMEHRAYIALGSNLGDRIAMIEEACRRMDSSGQIKVRRTSSLWETKAMYVLDQDKFVNGVCEVRSASH